MAAFQAVGSSTERRERLNSLEIGFAMMIGASTLKKKGSKPSDPDVFGGSDLSVVSLGLTSFCNYVFPLTSPLPFITRIGEF